MVMANGSEVIGIAAGVVACLSVVPQIVKNWRTRSSKDISTGTILLAYLSETLAVIYGVQIRHFAVWGTNCVLLTLYATLHLVKFRNERAEVRALGSEQEQELVPA
jgi:MtN3 and saliva related transmembrane protein